MADKKYIVSPSPHVHADISTTSVMRDVIIALCPAVIASVLEDGSYQAAYDEAVALAAKMGV